MKIASWCFNEELMIYIACMTLLTHMFKNLIVTSFLILLKFICTFAETYKYITRRVYLVIVRYKFDESGKKIFYYRFYAPLRKFMSIVL